MKKTLLLSQLIIALLLALSGKAYSQRTLTIDDVDFDAVNGIITAYKGSATDIIIPESFMVNGKEVTVLGIQYYAFQKKGLTAVSFPNTLSSIDFLAFFNNSLTSVDLPAGLVKLGRGAFTSNKITRINGQASNGIFLGLNPDGTEDNTKLVSYGGPANEVDFIPSSITEIQPNAFQKCSLTLIEIPDGIESIGASAFEGNELSTLILPNSITSIHTNAFSNNKLMSVKLSESITDISHSVFNKNLLTTIDIPEGITLIRSRAFSENKLQSISLPNSLIKIEHNAFLKNEISSISLPAQLEVIDFSAFQNNLLTELSIPASLTTINSSAFYGNKLNRVTFEASSNITTISTNAFANNTSLSHVKLPSHADAQFNAYIDADGKEYSVGESITKFNTSYRASIIKTLSADDVSFNTSTGTISRYTGSATDIIIPESFTIDGIVYPIKNIWNNAFENKQISSVVFSDNLESIGYGAFSRNNISELIIPENCEVGKSCFSYNNIKTLSIPASMVNIPNGCFAKNSFTEITIPATVKTIGLEAFASCGITTLNLQNGLEEIGRSAFQKNKLSSVTIPNSVNFVGETAFFFNQLTEVLVDNSVPLGGGAFTKNSITSVNGAPSDGLFYKRNGDGTFDNTKLISYGGTKSVIDFLSNEITEIDNYAFQSCALTSVKLPAALTHIGYSSFHSAQVQNISIPNALKHIGKFAFSRCYFASIVFPKSIEYIGLNAFEYSRLSTVTFENESNLKYISNNAFLGTSNLNDAIVLPTSGIANFVKYYDKDGNEYEANNGLLNDKLGCFARYKKVLTLDDVEFDKNTGTITEYYGLSTDIIIPESFVVDGVPVAVVNIGEKAFYSKGLFSVKMANSISTIEDNAFSNNRFMEEVILSTKLITLGKNAFIYSVPDTGIELPNSGVWHISNTVGLGTEVSKIEPSKFNYYYHRVWMVNFIDHDARLIKEQAVMLGASATAPLTPSRTGYTFKAWNGNYTNVTENLTITAEYTINTYTVYFRDYNSIILKREEVNYNSAATAPLIPTRIGYTFSAWDKTFNKITQYTLVTALYTRNIYTVNFKDHDGSLLKSEEVNHGSTATAPSNLIRTGYTFTGWDVAFDNVTEDITVIAQYAINKYSVRFEDWDKEELKTEIVDYNLSATAPASPTQTGYTFTGWDVAFDNVTEDITVTAQYTINKYSVRFEDWNQEEIKTEMVDYNLSATAPSNIIRTGYTFTGWDVAFDNVTEDITVIAKYAINKYRVRFEDWNKEEIKTEVVDYNLSATAPASPTQIGYTFTGWDVAFDNVTEDITVTAQYIINKYSVRFEDWNQEEIKTEMVDYNLSATAPASPTQIGYTFTGWDATFDNVREDIIVTAQYAINKYSVRFEDWNHEELKTEMVDYNLSATAPSKPIRDGYTFIGWNIAFDNITANIIITAQYLINYTVSFKDYDGTFLKVEEVASGSAATAPLSPTRAGYTFTGWDAAFDNVTNNITVTAEYINYFTIRFEDYDGTFLKSENVNYGLAATAPPNPIRTGYTFSGWNVAFDNIINSITVTAMYMLNTYTVRFEDYDGTLLKSEEVDYGSSAIAPSNPTRIGYTFIAWDVAFDNVTDNIIVTSEYLINTYTVSFEDYDGTLLKSEEVDYGSAAIAPSNPTRIGYTFTAWNVAFDNITDNIIVTAEYLINTYTVSFEDYDGTLLKSEEVDYGSAATAPLNPTRIGYAFIAWDIAFDNITNNITVTAVYDIATGIEIHVGSEYNVYPNPVKDILNIDLDISDDGKENKISIYNISGQLIYSDSDYGNKKKVAVGDWKAGFYIVVMNNKRTKIIKL